ncbi:MAG: ABC transporter substrate binding protein [Pikeienuella sp.]|uniref:ABC transporter substrate binding protein n=1 Tax=Pikeienuella sp. TaxID=2831957 RepID=UPI00391C3D29
MKAAALLFTLALALAGARAEAFDRIGDWFKIAPEAAARWEADLPDPADEMRVRMRLKGAPEPTRRIYVVYPRKSSAYDIAMTTLLEAFASRADPPEIIAVNFEKDPAQGEAILREAAEEGAALAFAMGSETVEWLAARPAAPPVPVVTICAKDPVPLGQIGGYREGSGRNIAFTSLNLLVDVQVEHLKLLKPALKGVAILTDESNVSAVETQARPIAAALREIGVETADVVVAGAETARSDLERLLPAALERLRAADPELDDSLIWITGATAVFAEIGTINRLSGSVPVLSVAPEVVQAGEESAALSIGVSFESNARLAAAYAFKVLSGEAAAGDLPVGVVSPPDIAINFLHARRIGLSIPFPLFEAASAIYGPEGAPARLNGRSLPPGG